MFLTLNRYFYPSTSSTTSVRADQCQSGDMSRQNVRCQGCCRAECSTLKPSGLVSDRACQGKVAVCRGVKVLSPDIFDPYPLPTRADRRSRTLLVGSQRANNKTKSFQPLFSSLPRGPREVKTIIHTQHTTRNTRVRASCPESIQPVLVPGTTIVPKYNNRLSTNIQTKRPFL